MHSSGRSRTRWIDDVRKGLNALGMSEVLETADRTRRRRRTLLSRAALNTGYKLLRVNERIIYLTLHDVPQDGFTCHLYSRQTGGMNLCTLGNFEYLGSTVSSRGNIT